MILLLDSIIIIIEIVVNANESRGSIGGLGWFLLFWEEIGMSEDGNFGSILGLVKVKFQSLLGAKTALRLTFPHSNLFT